MAALISMLPTLKDRRGGLKGLPDAIETKMLSMLRVDAAPHASIAAIAHQAATYHLTSGGQQTRARISTHACFALALSAQDAVLIAATAELAHNGSLIHYHLQDRDRTRHGKDSEWVAFSDGVAICVGDLLLSASYCSIAGISHTHLLPSLIVLVHSRVSDASIGNAAEWTLLLPNKSGQLIQILALDRQSQIAATLA